MAQQVFLLVLKNTRSDLSQLKFFLNLLSVINKAFLDVKQMLWGQSLCLYFEVALKLCVSEKYSLRFSFQPYFIQTFVSKIKVHSSDDSGLL